MIFVAGERVDVLATVGSTVVATRVVGVFVVVEAVDRFASTVTWVVGCVVDVELSVVDAETVTCVVGLAGVASALTRPASADVRPTPSGSSAPASTDVTIPGITRDVTPSTSIGEASPDGLVDELVVRVDAPAPTSAPRAIVGCVRSIVPPVPAPIVDVVRSGGRIADTRVHVLESLAGLVEDSTSADSLADVVRVRPLETAVVPVAPTDSTRATDSWMGVLRMLAAVLSSTVAVLVTEVAGATVIADTLAAVLASWVAVDVDPRARMIRVVASLLEADVVAVVAPVDSTPAAVAVVVGEALTWSVITAPVAPDVDASVGVASAELDVVADPGVPAPEVWVADPATVSLIAGVSVVDETSVVDVDTDTWVVVDVPWMGEVRASVVDVGTTVPAVRVAGVVLEPVAWTIAAEETRSVSAVAVDAALDADPRVACAVAAVFGEDVEGVVDPASRLAVDVVSVLGDAIKRPPFTTVASASAVDSVFVASPVAGSVTA